jgi:hypothetical protein
MMIYHEMRTNIRDMKNFCTLPFPHKRRGESTVNLSTENKKESVVDDRERKIYKQYLSRKFSNFPYSHHSAEKNNPAKPSHPHSNWWR